MTTGDPGPYSDSGQPGYGPAYGPASPSGYGGPAGNVDPSAYGIPSGYGAAPGYGPPPGYYAPVPATRPTNGLAIASIACAAAQIAVPLTGIAAIICGHMARKQIRSTGENGDGLALAGMIIGYVGIALTVIAIIAIIAFVSAVNHAVQQTQY